MMLCNKQEVAVHYAQQAAVDNLIIEPPRVSVIVPVYNVAPYLRKCLDSIAQQSLRDLEVILVDDGSTDESGAICCEFARQDARFVVVSKANEGQGVARNIGLEMARGRYVAFVDGDDWIEPCTYEDCAAQLDWDHADFINFGLDFITARGKIKASFGQYRQRELEGDRLVECALLDDQIFSSPCNKLYRRSTLERAGVRFPTVRACEDVFFSRALALASTRAIFTRRVYYHALVRLGSTTRGLTPATLAAAAQVVASEQEYFAAQGRQSVFETCFRAHVLKLFAYLLLLAAFRASDSKSYRECHRIANEVCLIPYANDSAAVAKLSSRSRILLGLTRRPRLLRALAQFTKTVLRWSPY